MSNPISGSSTDSSTPAVFGDATQFEGVRGASHAPWHGGVVGINDSTDPNAGPGVYGESKNGEGVRGVGHGAWHGAVVGTNDSTDPNAGQGVYGESKNGEGVRGVGHAPWHAGVVGTNDSSDPNAGAGVYGESKNGEGVRGISHSANHAGVVGTNDDAAGVGVYGQGARLAGEFIGDLHVSRNVIVDGDVQLTGADCAEEFYVEEARMAPPGTVMVAGERGLVPCDLSYDRRVVGVVSGAGSYRPAMVLDRKSTGHRRPIALVGKAFCLVDASYGSVAVGDLLTTSETIGHARKAEGNVPLTGTVIGKALSELSEGRELVPILVALQ